MASMKREKEAAQTKKAQANLSKAGVLPQIGKKPSVKKEEKKLVPAELEDDFFVEEEAGGGDQAFAGPEDAEQN